MMRYEQENKKVMKENKEKGLTEEELKECTFHPKINHVSRSMAGYVRPLSLEDSVSYYQDLKQKRIDLLKKKYEKESVIFSFKPQISKKSQQLIFNDEPDCFNRLHKESIRREVRMKRLRKEITNAECPFHPNSGVSDIIPKLAIENFLTRYEKDMRIKMIKKKGNVVCERNHLHNDLKNEIRDKPKISEKSKTMFQKKANESKEVKRVIRNNNCHERLFKDAEEFIEKREKMREVNRNMFVPHIPENTKKYNEKLLEGKLRRKFAKIFKILDSDHDGFISSKRINLEELDVKTVSLLSDMLYEVEDFDLQLNKNQFCKACINLYNSLPYHKKVQLMNSKVKREKSENMNGEISESTMSLDTEIFSEDDDMFSQPKMEYELKKKGVNVDKYQEEGANIDENSSKHVSDSVNSMSLDILETIRTVGTNEALRMIPEERENDGRSPLPNFAGYGSSSNDFGQDIKIKIDNLFDEFKG